MMDPQGGSMKSGGKSAAWKLVLGQKQNTAAVLKHLLLEDVMSTFIVDDILLGVKDHLLNPSVVVLISQTFQSESLQDRATVLLNSFPTTPLIAGPRDLKVFMALWTPGHFRAFWINNVTPTRELVPAWTNVNGLTSGSMTNRGNDGETFSLIDTTRGTTASTLELANPSRSGNNASTCNSFSPGARQRFETCGKFSQLLTGNYFLPEDSNSPFLRDLKTNSSFEVGFLVKNSGQEVGQYGGCVKSAAGKICMLLVNQNGAAAFDARGYRKKGTSGRVEYEATTSVGPLSNENVRAKVQEFYQTQKASGWNFTNNPSIPAPSGETTDEEEPGPFRRSSRNRKQVSRLVIATPQSEPVHLQRGKTKKNKRCASAVKGRTAAPCIPADAARRKRERQVSGSATPAKSLKSSDQAFSSDTDLTSSTDQAATVTCNSGYSDRQLAPSLAPRLAPSPAPSLAPRPAPLLAPSPAPSPLNLNIGDLIQLQALFAPNPPAHTGTANFVRAIFAFALNFFD